MRGLDVLLARGRAAHEDLMVDTVRVYRQGEGVFDRATGTTVPGPQTLFYGPGRGRVKPSSLSTAMEEEAGEREVVFNRYEVALPWGSPMPEGQRILPGDLVEVAASPDARLTGLTLWVTGVQFSATATAWRIETEDRS
ncbi:DUF6093 family protein [Actinacidiphila sp. ITFR-21]|uniref:DUF6093 family protein n=1 Tax=Actinacidiphila sp. ITFR-21 TaxID=3075199 RepID=UPI00288BE181|nr:DUF6093 family protein [Streptomyces sp. ITFR-21]WNI16912.1 DUF6093 family protein [Streptomyces sp. ITFR-21]